MENFLKLWEFREIVEEFGHGDFVVEFKIDKIWHFPEGITQEV